MPERSLGRRVVLVVFHELGLLVEQPGTGLRASLRRALELAHLRDAWRYVARHLRPTHDDGLVGVDASLEVAALGLARNDHVEQILDVHAPTSLVSARTTSIPRLSNIRLSQASI